MIKKILYNLLITFGLLLLTSKSCGPYQAMDEKDRLKERQDSLLEAIKEDFSAEYLFEERLLASGEKAKQMLFDFADYLSLYSCKDMDTLFRHKTSEMMAGIFYRRDPVVELLVVPMDDKRIEKCRLDDLLAFIDGSEYASMKVIVSDVKYLEPLHLEDNERYVGMLGCFISISGMSGKDSALIYARPNRVKFITTRTEKQFGADTALRVWQVFLDELTVAE